MTFFKSNNKFHKIILAGILLALSYIMPFLTGQIPEIGAMLCPMHIPVLLCGFFCGGAWGFVVGFIAPLIRSLTLGMPPFFPVAVSMAFELAVYGAASGIMHRILPNKRLYIYCSLIVAMVLGRIVWGIAMLMCMGISGGSFTFAAFLAGAITNAVPGIIVQIIFVPLIVSLKKRG